MVLPQSKLGEEKEFPATASERNISAVDSSHSFQCLDVNHDLEPDESYI